MEQRDARSGSEASIEVVEEEEVRRQEEEERQMRERVRAEVARDKQLFDLLTELLQNGRIDEDWIHLMVQIGVLTDRETVLPCEDPTRNYHGYDWVRSRNQELELRAREAAGEVLPVPAKYADLPPWRLKNERALKPTKYGCPFSSNARYFKEPLGCIEARRMQADLYKGPDDPAYLQPDDPVVQLELRPCYVVGERAINAILSPIVLLRVRAEQNARREPGKA